MLRFLVKLTKTFLSKFFKVYATSAIRKLNFRVTYTRPDGQNMGIQKLDPQADALCTHNRFLLIFS